MKQGGDVAFDHELLWYFHDEFLPSLFSPESREEEVSEP
jgi:hypothetical protein